MAKNITKLELSQRLDTMNQAYAALREKCAGLEADVARLTRERDAVVAHAHTRAPAQAPKPLPVDYDDYYVYVGACRRHAKDTRNNVVTYATREQFLAAHGA